MGSTGDAGEGSGAQPVETGQGTGAKRSRGRPRSRKTEAEIIQAAGELLASGGYAGVTFDKVASRAGVTRPTIYRRWASKAALIFAVLGSDAAAAPRLDADSFVGDLREIQQHFARIMAEDAWVDAMPGLLADLRSDPGAEARFQDYWRGAVDAAISEAVERAMQRGELKTTPAVALVGDLIIGPLFFRALMSPGSLTSEYVDAIFAQAVSGLRV